VLLEVWEKRRARKLKEIAVTKELKRLEDAAKMLKESLKDAVEMLKKILSSRTANLNSLDLELLANFS